MNRDIAILREAVGKIVQMLGGLGLQVTQQGTQAYVITDKVTLKPIRVNIPMIPDNATEALILAIQGFIDHEVAHILFTDWTVVQEAAKGGPHLDQLHNIVEDPYIEREIGKRFPGSVYNVGRLHDFFLRNITQPALDKAKNDTERFQVLMVPVVRAWFGQRVFQEFLDRGDHWKNPFIAALLARMDPALLARMPYLKDSAECLDVARVIKDILFPPAPPPPPPPPSGPSEPSEEDGDSETETSKSKGKGKGEKEHEEDSDDASGGEADESDTEADEDEENPTGAGGAGEKEDDEGEDDEGDEKDEKDEQDGSSGSSADEEDEGEEEGDAEAGAGGSDDSEDEDEDGAEADGEDDAEGGDSEDEDAADDSEEDGAAGSEGEDEESTGGGDASDADDDADDVGADGDAGDEGSVGGETPEEGEAGDTPDKLTGEVEIRPHSPFDDIEVEVKDFDAQISVKIAEDAARETRGASYRLFTRDYDQIRKHEKSRTYQDQWLVDLDDKTRHMVGVMQKDIERMMAARSQVVQVPGYRSGRLHSGGLHKLAVNDDRVFRRRFESRSKDTVVGLLVDNSGSMGGYGRSYGSGSGMNKMATAMSAAYALSMTLDRVGIAHEVMGFTTLNTPMPLMNAATEERKRTGLTYSRIEPLLMPIYKDFDERLTPAVKQRFADATFNQSFLNENIDGECVEIATQRLLKRRETRKVLLVLSDGSPACRTGNYPEIYSHLHKVVGDAGKARVDLIGIGIMDDSVKTFYPRHVVLNDLTALPGAVMGELKRILLD